MTTPCIQREEIAKLVQAQEQNEQTTGELVRELALLNVSTEKFNGAMLAAKKDALDSLQISKNTLAIVKEIRDQVLNLTAQVGTAPNEVAGHPGSGLTGIVVRMSRAVDSLGHRYDELKTRQADSIHDIDRLETESEITKIQNRNDLVDRARRAETSLEFYKAQVQDLQQKKAESQQKKADEDAAEEKRWRAGVTKVIIWLAIGSSGGGVLSKLLEPLANTFFGGSP